MTSNILVQREKKNAANRPLTKTRKFSTRHIEIFEQVLLSDKSPRILGIQFGYSINSHMVIDHSRKVMQKLLNLENLLIREHDDKIKHPKKYRAWWYSLLSRHREKMMKMAIEPQFYESPVR